MSFWTKTLRPIVKVAARAVAAVYTGGASEALLAATGNSGMGIADLLPAGGREVIEDAKASGNVILQQTAERYPNAALLVSSYRDYRVVNRGPESVAFRDPDVDGDVDDGDDWNTEEEWDES